MWPTACRQTRGPRIELIIAVSQASGQLPTKKRSETLRSFLIASRFALPFRLQFGCNSGPSEETAHQWGRRCSYVSRQSPHVAPTA
jgi:hypothetical protein